MVVQTLLGLADELARLTLPALRNLLVLAVVFTLLQRCFAACNPGAPWWRKPDLSTDLCFALIPRLVTVYAQTALFAVALWGFYGVRDPAGIAAFFSDGWGPLAGLAFWQQVVLYLVGGDLIMYGSHRLFHTVHLWRFHAAHHAPELVEWTSSARAHPVEQVLHAGLADTVMLLLGVPPEVLMWLMPWSVGSAALVHANLDWDFGRGRYWLASPVFHRWHHTHSRRGGSSNFAGTFPFWDLVFGTFHMPANERPDAYGLDEAGYPQDFWGQMIAPFRRRRVDGALLPAAAPPPPPCPAGHAPRAP